MAAPYTATVTVTPTTTEVLAVLPRRLPAAGVSIVVTPRRGWNPEVRFVQMDVPEPKTWDEIGSW